MLLVLGRVSNLPTVWSNCLAAWLLNGGGSWPDFSLLCAGATLLYTGGMFLNDAFDVEFDRQHRAERPIPAGQIAARTVWLLGATSLLSGWLLLLPLGAQTALTALLLLAAIVVYDAVHKRTAWAPILMAACRFLLYVVAAAAVNNRVGTAAIWHGLALAAYIVGQSFLARGESNGVAVEGWPTLFLIAPVVANVAVNPSRMWDSWIASAFLVAWTCWCVRKRSGGVGRTVAGLLAGIVLVDWSAVANPDFGVSLTFAVLFLLALILHRKVPAT